MPDDSGRKKAYLGRLAPAPTGALHLGNARTFLIAWLRARRAGGRIVLRLEDLDHPKVKPQAASDAYRDLAWLGLDWDAGPAASCPPYDQPTVGDPFIQSQRAAIYAEALHTLRRQDLVYLCVCSRKDLENLQSAPNAGEDLREKRYPGVCRDRFRDAADARRHAGGREPVWRFRVEEGEHTVFEDGFAGRRESVLSQWSGDFAVARGDHAAYQLAVVVDDHAMGVAEVVRGDDLIPSSHRQLALYRALGFSPPAFYHVPLVVGPDGRRLAKRHGDTRIGRLRMSGKEPEQVLGWLAWSCGWLERPAPLSLEEVAAVCDFGRIPKGPVAVTGESLAWLGL